MNKIVTMFGAKNDMCKDFDFLQCTNTITGFMACMWMEEKKTGESQKRKSENTGVKVDHVISESQPTATTLTQLLKAGKDVQSSPNPAPANRQLFEDTFSKLEKIPPSYCNGSDQICLHANAEKTFDKQKYACDHAFESGAICKWVPGIWSPYADPNAEMFSGWLIENFNAETITEDKLHTAMNTSWEHCFITPPGVLGDPTTPEPVGRNQKKLACTLGIAWDVINEGTVGKEGETGDDVVKKGKVEMQVKDDGVSTEKH